MKNLYTGVDLIEISRLAQLAEGIRQRFYQRVFTPAELAYSQGKKRQVEHLSGRFAAKEAVLKLLGTGLIRGMKWTDVEVVNEPSGRPRVCLHGECQRLAQAKNLGEILISISHIETHAIASAIATGV
jgi:holo-[acyl-carrier protein] synthase